MSDSAPSGYGSKFSEKAVQSGNSLPHNKAENPGVLHEHGVTFDQLKPSDQFVNELNAEFLEKLSSIKKEVEVYLWMARAAPKVLTDYHWQSLLKRERTLDRIKYLIFLTTKQKRGEVEKEILDEREVIERERERITMEGGMAYGTGGYRLLPNPCRSKSKIRMFESCKLLASMRIDEKPHLLFDMMNFKNLYRRSQHAVADSMNAMMGTNFALSHPFQINFVNFYDSDDSMERNEALTGYIYSYASKHVSKRLLPEWTCRGIRDFYPNVRKEDFVYFSGKAQTVYDGPLRHKVYVICGEHEYGIISLANARKQNIQAYRLPLDRYVKWRSGHKFMPFVNLIKTLDIVWHNRGDWEKAVHENISRRHTDPRDTRLGPLKALGGEKLSFANDVVRVLEEMNSNS